MAKVASIAILACLLLLASTVAAEVCVYPDKKLKTCLKVDVALKARDCPSKSAQAGGRGNFYGTVEDCCKMEFGGKCTDYTTCVYPDKAAGTCIEKKVDFRPRDCPSLSAAAGGKGSFYSSLPDCCKMEFAGKCKLTANTGTKAP